MELAGKNSSKPAGLKVQMIGNKYPKMPLKAVRTSGTLNADYPQKSSHLQ